MMPLSSRQLLKCSSPSTVSVSKMHFRISLQIWRQLLGFCVVVRHSILYIRCAESIVALHSPPCPLRIISRLWRRNGGHPCWTMDIHPISTFSMTSDSWSSALRSRTQSTESTLPCFTISRFHSVQPAVSKL